MARNDGASVFEASRIILRGNSGNVPYCNKVFFKILTFTIFSVMPHS